jgi:hypothetical protein
MSLSRLKAFNKESLCPSATKLLNYSCEDLPSNDMQEVQDHLCECDFCNAELSLLLRHPATTEEIQAPAMPSHLRLLAKALLNGCGPKGEVGAEMAAYEISV